MSKTQNIDLLDQAKSQKYVEDLDSQVFQHQSPEERKASIDTLKNVGMLTEDSNENNIVATSGMAFALGQAKLAAGSMDRSERFAIGKTSINAVRDVETGGARIESNSGNSFSDGDQVNRNYGVNYKHPVQYGAHLAGVDTVEGDKADSGVIDSASNNAVAGLAITSTSMLADKAFNNGRGTNFVKKTASGAMNKIQGNTKVTDASGKSDWYNKKDVSMLEESGIIEKNADGNYIYSEGKGIQDGRVAVQESLSRPTVSAGASQKINAMPTKTPTVMPINAVIPTPSNIYSTPSSSGAVPNDNTILMNYYIKNQRKYKIYDFKNKKNK